MGSLLRALVLCSVGAWFLFATPIPGSRLVGPSVSYAQDDEPGDAPKKKEEKGGGGHGQQSFIWWVIKTSGPIGFLIFLMSIYFIATTSKLFLELRPVVAMPPDLVSNVKEKMDKRDFKGVYSSLKDQDCLYSKYCLAGLTEVPAGLEEARGAIERVAEVQTAEMEKRISMLAVLGTLGPMIGLLGTLQGMIKSFSVIAMSDTQLKASEVAEGISEALLLTFEGVALSVPAIYLFAVFKNRVTSMNAVTLLHADELVKKVASAAKSASAAPPKPAPAPAAAAAAPAQPPKA